MTKSCYQCGKKERLTNHHAIPQRFKPIKNQKIPLCRKCHEHLNRYEAQLENLAKRLEVFLKNYDKKSIDEGYEICRNQVMKILTEKGLSRIWEDFLKGDLKE